MNREDFTFLDRLVRNSGKHRRQVGETHGGGRFDEWRFDFQIARIVGGHAIEGVGLTGGARIDGTGLGGVRSPEREWTTIDRGVNIEPSDAQIVAAGPAERDVRLALARQWIHDAGGSHGIDWGERRVKQGVISRTVAVGEVNDFLVTRSAPATDEGAITLPCVEIQWQHPPVRAGHGDKPIGTGGGIWQADVRPAAERADRQSDG